MTTYSKQFDYAKRHSRCDGERDAMMFNGYKAKQAQCCNCGWAFPPELTAYGSTRIWCSHWTNEKRVNQFCRRWAHENNVAAGIAPAWAVKYTKERK